MSRVPRTFLVGFTELDYTGIFNYLKYTGQTNFYNDLRNSIADGMSPGLALCSMYAKICYKSLVTGKNANVTSIRDISDNIIGCFNQGHGSVFEHCWLNFMTTDCSRVFTHELVRHRVGTAFSQTSGRYVAIDDIQLVLPPEMTVPGSEVAGIVETIREDVTAGLRKLRDALIPADADFTTKKKMTSAIRRLAPNGQTNEIGWSVNVRSLRHLIEMRTSPAAEWEIRVVFNDVARIVLDRWPLMLSGHRVEVVDGLNAYTNLKV